MRSIKQIWAYAFGTEEVTPPKPDELAVAYGAALMQSGRYESAEAAIIAAWWAVPHFYTGRYEYMRTIAPMFFIKSGSFTEDEPEFTRAEARAMHDADPSDLPSGA